jgi:hypothetical protein
MEKDSIISLKIEKEFKNLLIYDARSWRLKNIKIKKNVAIKMFNDFLGFKISTGAYSITRIRLGSRPQ